MPAQKSKTNKMVNSSESSIKEKLTELPETRQDAIPTNELPPLSTSEDEQPIQKAVEEIEEEREEKPRKRKTGGRSINLFKFSCRNCTCFGCLSLILLLVLLVLAVYFRPPFLLNPLKKYVNQGYQPQIYETGSVVSINDEIANELAENGEATISEQQLQTLMNEKVGSEELFVDIEPSSLRVVKDIEGDSAVPLYLIIEISHTSDNKLNITKLGFQRYGVPKFIRDLLTDSAFSLLDASTAQGEDEGTQFVNSFVNQDNEDDIAGVRFEKDQVVVFLDQ